MRVIVTGLIGQHALGGVVWDFLQYMLGFRRLGHEVWYLEDTGAWPFDQDKQEISEDCATALRQIDSVMRAFGFEERWIYRNGANGSYHGRMDSSRVDEFIRSSDVLVNVAGACWLREPTRAIPCKMFLDGDPMFTHIKLALDEEGIYRDTVAAHGNLFSFGLNLGQSDCQVPTMGWEWKPTVQPVALEYWASAEPAKVDVSDQWTTVMNWFSYPPKPFEGREYGQKDREFERFLDLPKRSGLPFLLAMHSGIGNLRPTAQLLEAGWKIREPEEVIPDFWSYRDFVAGSMGEWSVAKHGYVASRSGWFSCRTACYLAAGRPAVVQDTGWTRHLPSGFGLLGFDTMEQAIDGLRRVKADYPVHCRAAREFAREHLEAGKVCADLLERCR